jgi:hypothetical protein
MEASAHAPACGALRLSAAHGGAVWHSQLSERRRHNDDSPAIPNNPRTQQRSTANSRAPPSSAAHSPTAPHTAMPQPEFRSLKIYISEIIPKFGSIRAPLITSSHDSRTKRSIMMLPDVVPMFEPGIAAHRRHRPSSALCLDGPGTARPSAACHANSWLSGQNLTDGWADNGKTGAVRSEVLMQPAPQPEQLTASLFKTYYSEFTMRGKCYRLLKIRANVRLPTV